MKDAHPTRTASVSAAYAGALKSFLKSRGLEVNVRVSTPLPELARIVGDEFAEPLTGAGRVLSNPALGLQFGTSVSGSAFGLLGLVAATASTVRESLEHLCRFEAI